GPNQPWQSHYAAARLRDESRVQLYGGDRKGLGRSARVYLYLASKRNRHSLPRCPGDRRALDHPLLNGSLRPARRWTLDLARNVNNEQNSGASFFTFWPSLRGAGAATGQSPLRHQLGG